MDLANPQRSPLLKAIQRVALVAGPAACVAISFWDFAGGQPLVSRTAGVAAWMAIWWICEAAPLSVTSLLPLALFPLLGILDSGQVAREYANDTIFLFVGGFLVALAMEQAGLHRRISLRILLWCGSGPLGLLAGFMGATFLISMWISNTAATMMMMAIVMAVITQLEAEGQAGRLPTALLLGVAYGATIGGMGTLVGTPPNMALVSIYHVQFPDAAPIGFARWFVCAFPCARRLAVAWLVLAGMFLRRDRPKGLPAELLRAEHAALGRPSWGERQVVAVFAALVVLWVFRVDLDLGSYVIYGWSNLLPQALPIGDGTVAIALSILLFLLPARDGRPGNLLDEQSIARLPWNIVLLFGGGFALAKGLETSGLAAWLAGQMAGLSGMNFWALLTVICLAVAFSGELTSNIASTNMLLPLAASMARAMKIEPLMLMVPITLACSCSFMLPVGTPPNAIVFSTRRIRMGDMIRAGLVLDIVSSGLIVAAMYLWGAKVWG